MQTKTAVFLGIILSGYIVGQVIPINVMFGLPATVLFTAFFIPYFGLRKCVKIVLVLATISFLLNAQTQIGINVTIISTMKNMGEIGYKDILSNMEKSNMTEADIQGNLTKIQSSWMYGAASLINSTDTMILAYLIEILTAPIIMLSWLFVAYYALKKAGFYRQVFAQIKNY